MNRKAETMSVPAARASRWLALLILVLGLGVLFAGAATQPTSPTSSLPDGADSTRVAEIVAAQPGDNENTAVILLQGPINPAELAPLGQQFGGPVIPNEDLSAAIIPVQLSSEGLTDNAQAVNDLREEVAAAVPAGVSGQVTGPSAIQADLSNVFSGASFLLLGVTATIVAVLLVFTYRSPILWIIPLLVIGIADRVAATAVTWVLSAVGATWDESTLGILSVLVFGAGTNYALLLISRYRDELTRHENRFAAMAAAWGPTAKTVTISAVTVAIGVGCLLLSLIPSTRGLGLASAVGVLIALFFAVFCLPGMLVLFGRWVFWPKRPDYGDTVDHRFWDRIGDRVRQRPGVIAGTAFGLLAVASLGVLQISTGLSQAEQFLDTPESITAAEELGDAFPDQSATPAQVATTEPEEATGLLEGTGATVTPSGEPVDGWSVLQVSSDADTGQLRETLSGTDSLVGGQDAQLYDTEQAAERDRGLIFPLVLALILIALVVVLRSLVAPLIMVASVLLTNLAALGLGWWISTGILGFSTFDSTTPLYSFVFLVALGIDYTIFLITRARDDAARVGTKEGVLTALSSTGGVITSAGILLAAVFAALGVLPLVVLAQIGIVICIGVLLDTLVVRTLLVPSIVQLLGDKFWWPSRVDSKPDTDTGADSGAGNDSPVASRAASVSPGHADG